MISLQDVQAAQSRIAPYITRTPLLRVPALDEALGCEVYMTRETNDVDISNQERAIMMNELGVDLVLRIHCNGSTNNSRPINPAPISTFYSFPILFKLLDYHHRADEECSGPHQSFIIG